MSKYCAIEFCTINIVAYEQATFKICNQNKYRIGIGTVMPWRFVAEVIKRKRPSAVHRLPLYHSTKNGK